MQNAEAPHDLTAHQQLGSLARMEIYGRRGPKAYFG